MSTLVSEPTDNSVADFSRFWEAEEPPPPQTHTPAHTPEQTATIHHYDDTTTYTLDGRPVVRLPFIEGAASLGHSKAQAVRRFISMERRFAADPVFRDKYKEFIQEFLDKGALRVRAGR